jgi:hypothetical protein
MSQIIFIFLSLLKQNLVADETVVNSALFTVYIIDFPIVFNVNKLTVWTESAILTVFLTDFLSEHSIFLVLVVIKYICWYFILDCCFQYASTLRILSEMLITFYLFYTRPAKIVATFTTNHFIASVYFTYMCFANWTFFCTLSQKLLIHCFF